MYSLHWVKTSCCHIALVGQTEIKFPEHDFLMSHPWCSHQSVESHKKITKANLAKTALFSKLLTRHKNMICWFARPRKAHTSQAATWWAARCIAMHFGGYVYSVFIALGVKARETRMPGKRGCLVSFGRRKACDLHQLAWGSQQLSVPWSF